LEQLQSESTALFANRAAFAPGLDWVERILPRLPAACREAARNNAVASLAGWLAWVGGPEFQAVEVAGKGAVFAWRRAWTLRLLEITQQLLQYPQRPDADMRARIAAVLAKDEIAGLRLPQPFWRCLLDYLLEPPDCNTPDASRRSSVSPSSGPESPLFYVPFPCVLSEQMVIDGAQTNVVLAMFTARLLPRGSGEVFLHPEQIALRCMDAGFIGCFAQVSAVLRRHLAESVGELPDFCLRLQALRPDQESFLQGITLSGGSGAGALALTLYGQYAGLAPVKREVAASFAFDLSVLAPAVLDAAAETEASIRCVPVNGVAEKVRGCAAQGIDRLLVATGQQEELALYGRRNGVAVIGIQTFAEAVSHLMSLRLEAPGSRVPQMHPLRERADEEEQGGIVPTGSRYYVVRPQDAVCYEAIDKRPMILLVKGARQMGKSSLLVRGVERAREAGYRMVWTDMQKLNAADLATLPSLYLALANMLTRQLKLGTSPQQHWNPNDSPNMNFEYFLLDQVLDNATAPIVWFIDEVDRLFARDFYSEVFGLMRSWHNDRGVQPLWQRLTLVLSYATETHLFISNGFQSPFNVGVRTELEAFTPEEVADLNARYGSPLRDAAELARYGRLTGGHPYLTRRGYAWMTQTQTGVDAFAACACQDDGPLGDHLRRLRSVMMQQDHAAALTQLLRGRNEMSLLEFYQLRSAGIINGDSPSTAALRCEAYDGYLRRYLLR
jgi:hypothetical protein